jgi:hypothetical protein
MTAAIIALLIIVCVVAYGQTKVIDRELEMLDAIVSRLERGRQEIRDA